MATLNDAFAQELRARAIAELTIDIESAAPAQGVAKLSASLYSLMLQTVEMSDENEYDLLDGIETAMSEFDHDLSDRDRLDLADYRVAASVTDNGHPVINVEIRYKNSVLTSFSSDIPTLKLMAWKRKRQLG